MAFSHFGQVDWKLKALFGKLDGYGSTVKPRGLRACEVASFSSHSQRLLLKLIIDLFALKLSLHNFLQVEHWQ